MPSRPVRTRKRGDPRGRPDYPTKEEAKKIARQVAADHRERNLQITGRESHFATLSLRRSHDPILSMAWELHGRLVVFKWKQFLWGLRVRRAVGLS